MRCSKCGYNSFDHNLNCPKCRKDLTVTRRLLNLDVPAPGQVNYFQIASQRMAAPQPFLGAADAGYDDLEPMEEIQPVDFQDNGPAPAAPETTTMATQPQPAAPVYYAAPSPQSSPQPQPVAPAAASSAGLEDDEIEIEVDDFEVDAPSRPSSEDTFTPFSPPPAHQAAMNQIKSALTETGDLTPAAGAASYVIGGLDRAPDDLAPPLMTAEVAPGPEKAPGPETGDDLTSLVGDLNLDELESKL